MNAGSTVGEDVVEPFAHIGWEAWWCRKSFDEWVSGGRGSCVDAVSRPVPRFGRPVKMQAMARTLSADDILPLVASLTPAERVRLLQMIAAPGGADEPLYRAVPPSKQEFASDEEPLAWEAGGWEDVG